MRPRTLAAAAALTLAVGGGMFAVISTADAADTVAQSSVGWQATCTTTSAGVCTLTSQAPAGTVADAVTLTLRNTFAQTYIKSSTGSTIVVQVLKANSTAAYVGTVNLDVHVDYHVAPTTPPTTPTTPPTTPPTTAPTGDPTTPTTTPPTTTPPAGFPTAATTGVPAGTTLTAYTGPCTITTANTVIDSKTIGCDLDIRATGVKITNSVVNGEVSNYDNGATSSFSITDSEVHNGKRDACMCVGSHDFTALRIEVTGGNRGMYCEKRCTITDSFIHGTDLKATQHASAIRVEQNTTLIHNRLQCDWTDLTDSEIGCSADMTGYPDFAPIHDNTITNNLFMANPAGLGFCAYGGGTGGKPYSGDAANATNIKFTDNVFQRGSNHKCGTYGPVTDFITGRTGNVWSGNVWDSGEPVPAA